MDNVDTVTPPQMNASGDTAILTLLPKTGPQDTETSELDKTIRKQADCIRSNDQVFRSILIPIKAVAGYLLTLTATLGFIVYLVQDGHFIKLFGIPEPAPVLNFLPLLVAGIPALLWYPSLPALSSEMIRWLNPWALPLRSASYLMHSSRG